MAKQFDSMQFLNLITNLESLFKIKLSEKNINNSNFKNVESIKKIINEKNNRTLIIAEIGPNHNGSLEIAKK